jgi:hypothetical protein
VLLGLPAAGLRLAFPVGRYLSRNRSILATVCGCVAGFGYSILINSLEYATVLTPERALVDTQNQDTLFHASIANMLVNYSTMSTGVDGFAPIQYHILSHVWLGCLSSWLGVTMLEDYYIGTQIIGIPMLLFGLSMATYLLRRSAEPISNAALFTLLLLLLLLSFFGILGDGCAT